MVRSLPADLACTVVTHSPGIAVALVERPLIEVILIGGRLFKHSVVAVGASALEGIARINADLFFMGVTGVHPGRDSPPVTMKKRALNALPRGCRNGGDGVTRKATPRRPLPSASWGQPVH
jgi:DeoR/GlpR family transcriptional regulator of sugar metabolism